MNLNDVLKGAAQEAYIEEFNLLKQELIDKHVSLGMPASGNWVQKLEVEVDAFTIRLVGEGYTEQLVDGRKPGKFPPIGVIEEWIRVKPIIPEGDISISSLAFLIARKIAQEGTKYFQDGGTDLVEAVITPARIQKIIDRVGFVFAAQLQNQFGREFQNIKVA